MEKEVRCPLWEICSDHWKYYSNIKCELLELIALNQVSAVASRLIEKEISKFLDYKTKLS